MPGHLSPRGCEQNPCSGQAVGSCRIRPLFREDTCLHSTNAHEYSLTTKARRALVMSLPCAGGWILVSPPTTSRRPGNCVSSIRAEYFVRHTAVSASSRPLSRHQGSPTPKDTRLSPCTPAHATMRLHSISLESAGVRHNWVWSHPDRRLAGHILLENRVRETLLRPRYDTPRATG